MLCASFVVAGATARLLRTRAASSVTFVVTGEVALCLELDRFPFAMAAILEGPLMVLRPIGSPTP